MIDFFGFSLLIFRARYRQKILGCLFILKNFRMEIYNSQSKLNFMKKTQEKWDIRFLFMIKPDTLMNGFI